MINIENYLRLNIVDVVLILISTFLVVLFAKKNFWSYAKSYLDSRENLIKKELDDALARDIKSKELLYEAKKKIDEVSIQAELVMSKVEIEAKKRADDIVNDARLHAIRVKNKAQEDIESSRREAEEQMKEEMGNIALLAARKLVEKEMDSDIQRKYIDDFIEKAGDGKWQA